jgi:hypothetical protein
MQNLDVVKHNSDSDSIDFYTHFVFNYREEAMMEFKQEIWPYLIYFLTEEERESYSRVDYRNIQNCRGFQRVHNIFVQKITALHGRKVVQFSPKKRIFTFKLERAYKEEENEFVMPWKSNEFQTYPKLKEQVIGFGKLAFTRHLWPDILPFLPHLKYYHTGVTLLRQDGHVDLLEVTKDDNDNVFRFRKRNVMEMMTKEDETRMFFDNTCLARRNALDTKKTLFRCARIHNCSMNYNLTGFNCDKVATWCLTGHIAWTTAVFQIDPIIRLPNYPGDVDERVLRTIEAQLQEP